MVKFGKKFFFNNKHIKKNRTFTIVIILVVASLIVTTFFITSQFYNDNNKNTKRIIKTYKNINIKLFDKLPYMLSYFQKLENTKLSDIKVTYPDNFNYIEDTSNCTQEQIAVINGIKTGEITDVNIDEAFSCMIYKANEAGSYNIKINIDKEEFSSTLNVIDDEAPNLIAKNHEIYEDETYYIDDFVQSCTDNSLKECQVDFLNTSLIDYSKYKEPGTYDIKIVAYDSSDNRSQAITVTLTIKKIIYYQVTFDSKGGSKVETQTVREGETINYPNTPTREGYLFKGWYYNNKEYDMNTPITSNITIIAKWDKIKINSSGGGSSSGGGGSSSGGGGSDNTCVKYKDFYDDISIYNYQFINNGTANDCLNTTSYESEANALIEKYKDDIQTDYERYHLNGMNCNGKIRRSSNVDIKRTTGSKIIGYNLTLKLSCAGYNAVTYKLHCSSKEKCTFY